MAIKLDPAVIHEITTDNVERKLGPLSQNIANRIFLAYQSPFWDRDDDKGDKDVAKTLIEVFREKEVSGWVGLAVMKRESSFANRKNNPALDDRNEADPFGVHFNEKNWPDGCGKNKLLKEDSNAQKSYVNRDKPECNAPGYRLPTFQESAERAAATISKNGLRKYNPRGEEYKREIDSHLRDILHRVARDKSLKELVERGSP